MGIDGAAPLLDTARAEAFAGEIKCMGDGFAGHQVGKEITSEGVAGRRGVDRVDEISGTA